jgi:hypothetical protein
VRRKVLVLSYSSIINVYYLQVVVIVLFFQGKSLNKQLHTGPDLTNRLLGVLLRFRQHEIAIVADIRVMFHQVRLNQADANMVRFLW